MEQTSILDRLVARLRAVGAPYWRGIAKESGISPHFLRKVAYNDRKNPQLSKVDAVMAWFDDYEQGKRQLPKPEPVMAARARRKVKV